MGWRAARWVFAAALPVLAACSTSREGEEAVEEAVEEPAPVTTPAVSFDEVLARLEPGELVDRCPELVDGADDDLVAVLVDRTGARLCLGPEVPAGIERAEPAINDFGSQVLLVFTPDGISDFNIVAGHCFSVDPDICPTGRAALVVDGAVISAPAINGPSFERDQITISGGFSADEAAKLAVQLTDEPALVVRPVLAELGPVGS